MWTDCLHSCMTSLITLVLSSCSKCLRFVYLSCALTEAYARIMGETERVEKLSLFTVMKQNVDKSLLQSIQQVPR